MTQNKEAFEPTGLIPRSIIRTVDRFLQQLLPGKEKIAIQEYRVSRYQILVSIKSLLSLICIPLLVNFTFKSLLFQPLIEHFWNSSQNSIFLNQYQEKRAFAEMQDFSEKMFFELLSDQSYENVQSKENTLYVPSGTCEAKEVPCTLQQIKQDEGTLDLPNDINLSSKTYIQLKSLELAQNYNKQSILAITNLLGDFVTFLTLYGLFRIMRPEIIILKSFLTESVYSLSDTTKSFLLILLMDLLVGFHSPRGWEIALEALLRHIGLPENENFILLFVALFPVFLDTVFKYWIFRYLNKISPSTVVTYHSMLE